MPPRFPIPKISGIRETVLFSRYFCGMLMKIILTVEGTEHEVPDHCITNWEDISFVCKRTDYSGVMRSFSSEFVFAGEAADLLFDQSSRDMIMQMNLFQDGTSYAVKLFFKK